jgi:exonuclease III
MTLLENLILKANSNDCVVILGDFNCKLGRNINKLAGKWCIHKTPNPEGRQLLEMMQHANLRAASTFFQPKKRKSNATFLARDSRYKPSQIDYILISARWMSSVRDCKVKWGITCQRWGRRYDHGLISCLLKTCLKIRRQTNATLDFSRLKSDENVQRMFDAKVRSNLSSQN